MPLSSIPVAIAQPDRPFLRAIESDVGALLGEQSVLAVYLPLGIDDSVTPGQVTLTLSPRAAKNPMAEAAAGGLSGRHAASGGASRLAREGVACIAAFRPQAGEVMAGSSGVGSLGGVTLKVGDRFVVPGWALGEAADTVAAVRGKPRCDGGMWTAEVSW